MERNCPRCGSPKIIPQVPLLEHYGRNRADQMEVEVAGAPEAWIFTDTASGRIYARICGECGYTELWTSNFRELYEKHERSIKDKS